MNNTVVTVRQGPGCLLQILWFIFVGWWLGAAAVGVAYLLFLPILTIPIGIAVLNNVPLLMALRQPPQLVTPYGPVSVRQINFIVRAIWFIFVGWWLAALILAIAYLLCLTIIGMPLGFILFDATPGFLTLRRTM
jgi:uncharacterized membrane protein YccF (DUF307 family)